MALEHRQLVEALMAAERGLPVRPLPPEVLRMFLDGIDAFRATVAYAALRLLGQLARSPSAETRAAATRAVSRFTGIYPVDCQQILATAAFDGDSEVRAVAAGVTRRAWASARQAR
jgi:hypothetical protein